MVSYAVYRIPSICETPWWVRRAEACGIRLIVEDAESRDRRPRASTTALLALGDDVAARLGGLLLAPGRGGPKDDNGKIGILHVKCAVADGRRLFLSSSNLTEYAFTINMELGVLVTGGGLPAQVQEHFDRLIVGGVVNRV